MFDVTLLQRRIHTLQRQKNPERQRADYSVDQHVFLRFWDGCWSSYRRHAPAKKKN
jgi:hypothetical protein